VRIASTLAINTQAIMNNIEIETNIESDLPFIDCDENQLKQVFINFLKNAIEAMPEGGKITIHVRNQDADKLILRFTDQGNGIPEEILSKLGQPFLTTKETYILRAVQKGRRFNLICLYHKSEGSPF
jgi:signal transduction histidine kinase